MTSRSFGGVSQKAVLEPENMIWGDVLKCGVIMSVMQREASMYPIAPHDEGL